MPVTPIPFPPPMRGGFLYPGIQDLLFPAAVSGLQMDKVTVFVVPLAFVLLELPAGAELLADT